jgi:YVTN family beta-propeller protein
VRNPLRTVAFRVLPAALALCSLAGCRHPGFPDTPAGYREYAFVANATANTVSVLDLVYLRADHTLQVGSQPTALAANPIRNEIYVVNTQSATVSVLDADAIRVAATIPVHRLPVAVVVDPTGHRAYVANSGSNSISVLDLDQRREIAEIATPTQPTALTLAPDSRSLIVTHAPVGLVSIFSTTLVAPPGSTPNLLAPPLALRATFPGCPGATSPVVLPDSSKTFIACSGGHQVMALNLAAAPNSWAAQHDTSLTADRMLTLLDVGLAPIFLALKPDGGEIFASNSQSDSMSEISTPANEVGGTYLIGTHPTQGVISDDDTLWIANAGDDSISLYSIDDGKLIPTSLHTGSRPEALTFSADQHLLLAVDTHSGDVSVIRTQSKLGPNLFTILPAGSGATAIVTKVIQRHPKA